MAHNPPTHRRTVPWLRFGATAAGIAALAVFAPVIWLAAAGGAGLLVVGGLLALGFAAIQVMPYLGQVLENQILTARKAEARRNPIEQLQNEVIRRAERLSAFRKALVTIGGQVESIEHMIEDRRYKDPGHILARHQKALERLKQFQTVNMRRLQQANLALDEFSATVERKESEWRIALAIGDATEMMDPNATDNLMQNLLTDTALRSVQDRFNTVFAELDVQMLSVDSPTRDLLDSTQMSHMESLGLSELQPQRSAS